MKLYVLLLIFSVASVCFAASTSPLPIAWSLNAHEAEVRDIAFSTDEQFVASAGADGLVKVRQVRDGTPVLLYLRPYEATAVAFSPRTNLFAAAGFGWMAAWSVPAFTLVWTNEFGTSDLAFSPDAQYIAGCFSSEYGLAFIVRASDGTMAQPMVGPIPVGYRTVAFTPDGTHFLAAFLDASIFNTSNWAKERSMNGTEGFVLSPDGRFLADPGITHGYPLRTYNFSDGSLHKTFEGANPVFGICYLGRGRHLAGTASGDTVRVWDAGTGNLEWIFTGVGQARAIASSVPGNYLAYGTTSGTLTLAYAPPMITRIQRAGAEIRLEWLGGTPLIQAQHRPDLNSGDWTDIGEPAYDSITLPDAPPGFYRVRNTSL